MLFFVSDVVKIVVFDLLLLLLFVIGRKLLGEVALGTIFNCLMKFDNIIEVVLTHNLFFVHF